MLQFFRKYQKIFFALITVVIVLSVVFFGTYQAFGPSSLSAQREEEESYTTQMARFLDTEDWMATRKVFSANFLNDSVISKDFLETGMAELISSVYPESFEQEFHTLVEREKYYQPYTHPFLGQLTAEGIWTICVPELIPLLKEHQSGSGNFQTRNALFLAQKKCPPALLTQIIRYQEQFQPPTLFDPRLAREDIISLFGYQTLTDWFGSAFMDKLVGIIIQMAEVARKQGYTVSQEEMLAHLVSASQKIYYSIRDKVELPVHDGYGFFQLYLQQLGIKEKTALKIWEDITLARRLLHGIGDAVLVDPLPLRLFHEYASESVAIELYQMPSLLRLHTMEDLKRLEAYLAAVGGKRSSPLDIPAEYASLQEIEERAPELVGRYYQLAIADLYIPDLYPNIPVKERVAWACDGEHWALLAQRFSFLRKKGVSPFSLLEQLEDKQRKLVDEVICEQMVQEHPDWIAAALSQKKPQEKRLFLNSSIKESLPGIQDSARLVASLEQEQDLSSLTQDHLHYYRIQVKERGEEKSILTYQESVEKGLLDKLVTTLSGASLAQAVVDASPPEYQKVANVYRFAQYLLKCRYAQPVGALVEQFRIAKEEKTISRADSSFIPFDEVLTLAPGEFSTIKVDPQQGAYYYRFIERKMEPTLPLEKLQKSQELLSKEARCRYLERLIGCTVEQ